MNLITFGTLSGKSLTRNEELAEFDRTMPFTDVLAIHCVKAAFSMIRMLNLH